MNKPLHAHQADSTLLLRLDRPDVRNALNTDLVHHLLDALHKAMDDDTVHAVVLTGTPPAFCAGGDLSDVPADADAAALAVRHRSFVALAQALRSLPKPVVAAVNGVAVGAGASVCLACDHIIMAADATLHLSFLTLGLPPDLLSISLLHQRAGSTVAADILYSARPVSADEALRLRLANEVATTDDVLARAVDAAHRLGSLPSFAFATTKTLLRHACSLGDAIVEVEPFTIGTAAASQEFLAATAHYRR